MTKAQRLVQFRKRLIAWYKKHQRDLPWRKTLDPYAIWVSEIMLQQTQVKTVLPYYAKFLKRFPTVENLARARIQTVLKVWEGLGYYSRARNLHRTAKIVTTEMNGRFPDSVKQLLQLPGIGPYTAGAIASFAFGHDEPILDGNVMRLLSRIFHIDSDITQTATRNKLWSLSGQLVNNANAQLLNQALMDFGATCCIPRKPLCLECPLETICLAKKRNHQHQLPVKAPRKPVPHYDIGVAVVWKDNRVLIDRRKPEGLLGGLWEFPGGKVKKSESRPACIRREVKEELGIHVKVHKPLIKVDHAYTHFRVTLHVYTCSYLSGTCQALECTDWKWVSVNQLQRFPFPTANHKIIAALG